MPNSYLILAAPGPVSLPYLFLPVTLQGSDYPNEALSQGGVLSEAGTPGW